MWLHGGLLIAAAAETPEPASAGVSDQLIIVIGGIITAAIVALGGVMVAMVNRGGSKTTASPPSPNPAVGGHELYERTAVHSRRLDDADERHHILDVTVDRQHDVLDDHGARIARLERQMRIHDETGRD